MKSDLDLKNYEKTIYERIDLLIRHFHAISDKLEDEEDVKSSIIDKFIDVLYWDLGDPLEVKKEQKTEGRKRADYALKVDGKPKIYIEAKSLDKDLEKGFDKTPGDGKRTYVEQTINYAYNSGVNWALLTNGKRWILFNAYWKGTHKDRIAFDLEIDDFLKDNNFDKIKLLAKEYVVTGKLDEYFKERPFRNPVDEEVVAFLLGCRRALTESVIKNNEGKYTTDQLREGIHRILDRLIFYKICEDRDILDYGRIKKTFDIFREDKSSQSFVNGLKSYYDWFNEIYDGEMFGPHFCEEFIVDNSVYKMLVDGLYQYDFATIDADILGRIYENYLGNTLQELEKGLKWVIDSKERKRFGQYYTPQYVVDYIIDNVGITRDSKILDPACGSGAFLIKAYDRLKILNQEYIKRIVQKKKHNLSKENFKKWQEEELPKIESESINQILARNIHGVDINPESVELTKVNMWLRSIQKDTPLNKLENNIECGNSLISGTEDELRGYFGDDWEEKRPFDWDEGFSEIMKEGGFDVVMGNPPYLQMQKMKQPEKSTIERNYSSIAESQNDLWYYFMCKGIQIIKNKGYLGFIVSRYFLEAAHAKKLRKFVLDNACIKSIIDFKGLNVFEGVGTHTTIIILQRDDNHENRLKNKIKISVVKNINDFRVNKIEYYFVNQSSLSETIWELTTSEESEIIKKLRKNSKKLGELCEIGTGIKTGYDKAFVVDESIINENKLEKSVIKPWIKNSQIKRYHVDIPKKYVLYITKKEKPDDISKIFSYLTNYRSILLKKNKSRNEDSEWWHLYRPREYLFDIPKEKIICPYKAKTNSFGYDSTSICGSGDIYVIISPSSMSLKYILGLLNSKVLTYYFTKVGKKKGNLYEYYTEPLKEIPIKLVPEPQQQPLITLVDKMLSLNKELQNINTNFFDYVNLRPKLKDTNLELYFNKLAMSDKKVLNNANGIKGKIKKPQAREEGEWLIISVNYEDENKKLVEDFDVLKCRFENLNFTKFIKHCILDYGKNVGKGNILDRVLKMENIPIFDNKSDVKNQQIIDEIMGSFLLAVEWKEKIESEIEETDRTIDQMVYELYGLTEEEIKIIEAST